jgi:Protein of unknown function (DUF1203)
MVTVDPVRTPAPISHKPECPNVRQTMDLAEDLEISGADPVALAVLRSSGIDHGQNRVEPFLDDSGSWPLRCCLQDSRPGELLAIVAWSPYPWRGAYAEVGPIVIHAKECDGPLGRGVPPQFLARRQLVRPYGKDRRIAYEDIVVVEPDGTLPTVLRSVLERDWIDFAIVRNVNSGCYSFAARRPSGSR